MATPIKKPAVKKPVVKPAPRVTAVEQLDTIGPHAVSTGLPTSLPTVLTPVPDALNPGSTVPPTATVTDTPKKKFSETGFGQFIAQNGGVVGIIGSLGSVVSTVSGNNSNNTATNNTPADNDADGNGSPDNDNFTVLGLPPFTFAALVALLIVGLVIVFHKSSDG